MEIAVFSDIHGNNPVFLKRKIHLLFCQGK